MISTGKIWGTRRNVRRRFEAYESQVESKISGLTSLLEPLMILFMGVTIGIIVVAVLLPIIQMTQVMR